MSRAHCIPARLDPSRCIPEGCGESGAARPGAAAGRSLSGTERNGTERSGAELGERPAPHRVLRRQRSASSTGTDNGTAPGPAEATLRF